MTMIFFLVRFPNHVVLFSFSCSLSKLRLTFWLSNTVVLREIISQAFGNSCHSIPIVRFSESNGIVKKSDGKSALKWKGSSCGKQVSNPGFVLFVDDWQETRTFTSALEKVESWIFSRIVESVWWQVKIASYCVKFNELNLIGTVM